jgi:hypothetical protein
MLLLLTPTPGDAGGCARRSPLPWWPPLSFSCGMYQQRRSVLLVDMTRSEIRLYVVVAVAFLFGLLVAL